MNRRSSSSKPESHRSPRRTRPCPQKGRDRTGLSNGTGHARSAHAAALEIVVERALDDFGPFSHSRLADLGAKPVAVGVDRGACVLVTVPARETLAHPLAVPAPCRSIPRTAMGAGSQNQPASSRYHLCGLNLITRTSYNPYSLTPLLPERPDPVMAG